MEKILMYITNHYLIFVIIAVALIISAVGFVVDNKKQELNNAKDVEDETKIIKEKNKKNKKQKK